MSEGAVKLRKINVDHTKDISKYTCLIHGPGHLSDEFKFLGDFSSKYSKIRSNNDYVRVPGTGSKFYIQQENNYIVNHAVDEILLQ